MAQPVDLTQPFVETLVSRSGSKELRVIDHQSANAILLAQGGVTADDLVASPALGRALTGHSLG